jgi:Tat protein translocase TatB subunit
LFLFIFESIGTSELIMVGIVALIFLGPRRLPDLARKAGKIMAEFRGTANEFKETWKREVDFEDDVKALDINTLEATTEARKPELPAVDDKPPVEMPAVREIDSSAFDNLPKSDEDNPAESQNTNVNDKQNWL